MTVIPPHLSDYFRDALAILDRNLDLTLGACPACYRIVAAQLRLLLCDTTRTHGEVVDISLAKRLWPDLRLHPLNPAGQFDPKLPSLPLSEWLAQPVPVQMARQEPLPSLRDLIRLVTDQDGGAHVDLKIHSPLWNWSDRADWIVRIGKYVREALASLELPAKSGPD